MQIQAGPNDLLRTRRRAAILYTYIEKRETGLTRRPLFQNDKLR